MITMAICDRCGRRIDLPPKRQIVAIETQYFGHLNSYMDDGAKSGADLCRECSNDFLKWLNEGKKKDV
jgi:hypothetical protein